MDAFYMHHPATSYYTWSPHAARPPRPHTNDVLSYLGEHPAMDKEVCLMSNQPRLWTAAQHLHAASALLVKAPSGLPWICCTAPHRHALGCSAVVLSESSMKIVPHASFCFLECVAVE
jgi:hypothetical protein